MERTEQQGQEKEKWHCHNFSLSYLANICCTCKPQKDYSSVSKMLQEIWEICLSSFNKAKLFVDDWAHGWEVMIKGLLREVYTCCL